MNPSLGAYNNQNELVAWCFQLPVGALGVLQTVDNYKRKGLGSFLVKSMAQLLVAIDMDTFGFVVDENYSSRKMFEKIGFSVIDWAFWMEIKG